MRLLLLPPLSGQVDSEEAESQGRSLGQGCPEGGSSREEFANRFQKGGYRMLWTIFVVLLILWLLGMVTSYTLYGYIHLLLLIAVVVLVIRLIQGRKIGRAH